MTAMQMCLRADRFDEAQDYERAAFGRLEIKAAGQLLTTLIRTEDGVPKYDLGPYVSGYHLAEWLGVVDFSKIKSLFLGNQEPQKSLCNRDVGPVLRSLDSGIRGNPESAEPG